MLVHGFTRVQLSMETGMKLSHTKLFVAKEERDKAMYQVYRNTFYALTHNYGKDFKGKRMMTEEEFLSQTSQHKDVNGRIFGVITGEDGTVQFEPFAEEL